MRKTVLLLALAALLAALPTAADARSRAATVQVAAPAPGGVAVALAKVKGQVARVSVTRAPADVIVTGGARKGVLALAVAAPRYAGARAAAAGRVVVRVTGRRAKPRIKGLKVSQGAVL